MTKVTILGEEPQETKKKPIEFVKECCYGAYRKHISTRPKDWKNIELIAKRFCPIGKTENHYDLMFAYDIVRGSGVLYLGHFNDGVVE